MATDEMYLDNLDEFINDENKIVTYKWLSRTLQVHVNQAKQMLYKFLQRERNAKDVDNLCATYLVAGVSVDKDGNKSHMVQIVQEESLEATKSVLKPVTSCHIYSVQRSKLKDSNALYTTDYDLLKEHILDSNKYSAITCKWAQMRSNEDLNRVQEVKELSPVKSKPSTNQVNQQNGTTSKKAGTQKKDISNMFAKAAKKKEEKDAKVQAASSKQNKKAQDNQGSSKVKAKPKQGGVMSFFSNQANKPKAQKKESPEKKEAKKEDEVVIVEEDEKVTAPSPPPSPEVKSSKVEVNGHSKQDNKKDNVKASRQKKKAAGSDSDAPQQKRRRIQAKVFESSSEDEDEEEMEVEEPPPPPPPSPPPPSPPPREPTPEPASPEKEKKDSDDDLEIIPGTPEATHIPGQRRRKRGRKMVPKTYVDDDGFMVTEKVWENYSTDGSEVDEPAKAAKTNSNKEQDKSKPQKVTAKKPSPKKTPPGKKGAKQASLMSFFKKK